MVEKQLKNVIGVRIVEFEGLSRFYRWVPKWYGGPNNVRKLYSNASFNGSGIPY